MEENIWEISISCPALRLPILLSPEQGRRTEEPLNGSQQDERGGFAAVGSRHTLGAGRLGSSVEDFFSLDHWFLPWSCAQLCRRRREATYQDRSSFYEITSSTIQSPRGLTPISHIETPSGVRVRAGPGLRGLARVLGMMGERTGVISCLSP